MSTLLKIAFAPWGVQMLPKFLCLDVAHQGTPLTNLLHTNTPIFAPLLLTKTH